MIKLQAIGHIGRDAELKNVGGKNVINFSIAHSEKNKDGQEKTIWIDCAKWGETTGILPFLKKGTKVFVDGNPDLRTYTKTDGTTATILTLRIAHIELLGGQQQAGQPVQQQRSGSDIINQPLDDLGF